MTATIEKQSLLRTGDLDFSATTASEADQYLVRISERTDKGTVAELFVAASGNPVPRGTLKQLGSGYLICDRISVSSAGRNAGYLWHVTVHWKEIESDEPQSTDFPTPNGTSTDPTTWTPSWSRRSQVIHEPAEDAFYLGGYKDNDAADQHLEGFAPERAPLLNSALQPFRRRPEHRRTIELWTFRWLRPSVPNSLIDAEGKLNSASFNINLPGLSQRTWAEKTALVDTIDLSTRRWGYVDLVEVSIDIIVDPKGWAWLILDKGSAARAMVGDPDGKGGTISGVIADGKPQLRQLKDDAENPIQDEVLLDGDGQPLKPPTADPVYGEWLDFETTAFADLPLIEDLS